MAKKQAVNATIDSETVEGLKQAAIELDTTVSAILDAAAAEWLRNQRKLADGRRAVAEYWAENPMTPEQRAEIEAYAAAREREIKAFFAADGSNEHDQ